MMNIVGGDEIVAGHVIITVERSDIMHANFQFLTIAKLQIAASPLMNLKCLQAAGADQGQDRGHEEVPEVTADLSTNNSDTEFFKA